MDRLGNTHDYRKAKLPSWNNCLNEEDARRATQNTKEPITMGGAEGGDEEEDEDGSQDEDEDEDEDDHFHWPKRAVHSEDFFGYNFDSGTHNLCKSLLSFGFSSIIIIIHNTSPVPFQGSTGSRMCPRLWRCLNGRVWLPLVM